MKTLTSFIVNPALYREVGIEAQPGDQVEIYLDQEKVPGFPEFILGTVQNPVTTVCGGTSYAIEYDEEDLDGTGVEFIESDDISSVVVVSEARVLFAIEQAAREAADDDLQDQIDECVRFTEQSMTTPQQAQARENLALPPLIAPLSSIALTPYNAPVNQYYSSFTITGLGGGSNGIYTFRGTYYGFDLYRQTGGTADVVDNTTLSGTGRIMFRDTDDNWYIALVYDGSVVDMLYGERTGPPTINDEFTNNPYHITTWYDYDTSEAVDVEVSDLVISEGTVGYLGQVAIGHSGLERHAYICYQTAPCYWKQITI